MKARIVQTWLGSIHDFEKDYQDFASRGWCIESMSAYVGHRGSIEKEKVLAALYLEVEVPDNEGWIKNDFSGSKCHESLYGNPVDIVRFNGSVEYSVMPPNSEWVDWCKDEYSPSLKVMISPLFIFK